MNPSSESTTTILTNIDEVEDVDGDCDLENISSDVSLFGMLHTCTLLSLILSLSLTHSLTHAHTSMQDDDSIDLQDIFFGKDLKHKVDTKSVHHMFYE